MAQAVGGALGAVVGFFVGGPAGAQWGWAIGSAIGASFTTIKQPRIGDLAEVRAGEGGARARVYGTFRPIGGQVVWAGKPREIRRRQRQGKGGPKVETSTILRSYAIGICEGPINGVTRIWRNNELVYDVRPGSQIIAESVRWLDGKTILLGGWDQMPHPTIQAEVGAGNAPAMRGTALLVVTDEDLTDMRGAIPAYQFEVGNSGQVVPGIFALMKSTTGRSVWGTQDFTSYIGPGELIDDQSEPVGAISYSGTRLLFTYGDALGATGVASAEFSVFPADLPAARTPLPTVAYRPLRRFSNRISGGKNWVTIDGGLTFHGFEKEESGTSGRPIDIARLDAGRWCLLLAPRGGPSEVMRYDGAIPTSSGWITITALPTSVSNAMTILTDGDDLVVLGFNGLEAGWAKSTDGGFTWSSGVISSAGTRRPVEALGCYATHDGGAYFCVLGHAGAQPSAILKSTGGEAWSVCLEHGVAGVNFSDITFGNGMIVAVAGNTFYVSADLGATWSQHAAPSTILSGDWRVTYCGSVFEPGPGEYEPETLPSVVSAICRDALVPAARVDVSRLPRATVQGFATSPDYTASDAIKELAKTYFFDLQDVDGYVRFVPRGGDFIAVVGEDEFVEGEDEPEEDTTRDSISVPRLLHLQYYDIDGGQAPDKQFSERQVSPRSESPTVLSTPIVLDAETAAKVISVQHKVMEEELRGELIFGLSDRLIAFAPADVLVVQYRGRSQRCRVTKVEIMDGWQRVTAVRDRQSAYTSQVQPIPPAPVTRPPETIPGPTRFAFLDIPALTQAGDLLGYHVATSGETAGWRGAIIERQDGSAFALLATDGTGTVMGTLTGPLPSASEWYPDETNAITVQLARSDDELASVSTAEWLGRANAAALVRSDGTAEIVQFRSVAETSEGVWRLSGLQRGRLNSGASAHPAGTTFVLLDGSLFVQTGSELLSTTLTHRAYSVGDPPTTATPQARLWTGRSQREWPPIIESATRTGDTLDVTWTPRHRFGSDENPIPSMHFEGWRVTATDGAASVSADTTGTTVTLDITGMSNPITITVQGRNRLAGLGDPATRIIT